ncbi:MAG: discoidin domain-containing protein [Bacteroidales bacterium]|jgi:hypothetical protein|nr:discoidin domain-containing protein [Bacteroidales bacterium]
MRETFELAGKNRRELEKALKHYSRSPKDSLKLDAAIFLLENMAEYYAYDTSDLHFYHPVLYDMDSLRHYTASQRLTLENKWDSLKQKYPLQKHVYERTYPDAARITARYLTGHIDLAMEIWKNNPYKDSITCEDFWEYVLPYRKKQGASPEDWQTFFHSRHADHLDKYFPQPLWVAIDSLFYQYRSFRFSRSITDYPYLKVKDMLISNHSVCFERCWFNTMMLSSIGIPSTIDYIPAWANRHDNHFWNTIQLKDNFYAVGTAWSEELWKYKKLYNNTSTDSLLGNFRIPKVYRYTYRKHDEGPISDERIDQEDIPAFFHNTNHIDVSREYFTVHDVHIEVNPVHDSPYCYLCVFNDGQWKPVQWGTYEKGQALFRDMGCGIVYLPAFYSKRKILPAGPPFILEQDGTIRPLKATGNTQTIRVERIREYWRRDDAWGGERLLGATVQAANFPDFSDAEDLIKITEVMHISEYFKVHPSRKYRYVRFVFKKENNPEIPADRIRALYGKLTEVEFFNRSGRLAGEIICSADVEKDNAGKALDGDWYTSMLTIRVAGNPTDPTWIGLDFGSPRQIAGIEVAAFNDDAFIYRGYDHKLFYWDKGFWHPLATQKATGKYIEFSGTPEGALLSLKCTGQQLKERIFTYENGQQVWW